MRTYYEIQMLPPSEREKWWRFTLRITTGSDTWTSPPSAPLRSLDHEGAYAEARATLKALDIALSGGNQSTHEPSSGPASLD